MLLLKYYSEPFCTSLFFSRRSPHVGHPFLFFFFFSPCPENFWKTLQDTV